MIQATDWQRYSFSFRPSFGFKSEGNAWISISKELKLVEIGIYVWEGPVGTDALMMAQSLTDDKLEYIEGSHGGGNGHESYQYRITGTLR